MNFTLVLTIAIFVVIAVAVEAQPLFEENCDYQRQKLQRLEEDVKRLDERYKQLEERLECPKGWRTYMYEDSCYKLFPDGKTLEDGKKLCSRVGGYLVEIETKRENDVIVAELKKDKRRKNSDGIWIGATNENTEGQWTWITTGNKVSFFDWSSGEPNNAKGIEHCLEIKKEVAWLWNDAPCIIKRSVLCEKDREN